MFSETFWKSVIQFLIDSGWHSLGAIIIVAGAFAAAAIVRVLIRRIVQQVVNGVKRKQNVDDTAALAASPLAAVRTVQRTRTLGSVLTNIANVTIAVIAILLILSVVAPHALASFALLSAAVGAGLGFGAQNIVRDVLAGLFIVVEDQLGVGDVVDTGFATGVVEEVKIRLTKVRDVNGTLWFVPNGQMLRIGNLSQGWQRVIVDMSIPQDADVDAVQDTMLQTAIGLASEPRWRSRIMEQPELWGIQSISDSVVIARVVIKTRTVAKDDVSRELRARLKAAADQLSITVPALNVVVLTGSDSALSVQGARPPRSKTTTVAKGGTPAVPTSGATSTAPATKPSRRVKTPGAFQQLEVGKDGLTSGTAGGGATGGGTARSTSGRPPRSTPPEKSS